MLPYVEFAFGLYTVACAVLSVMSLRAAMTAPFLIVFAFGFFYVSVLSLHGPRAGCAAAGTDVPVVESAQ